MVDSDAINQSYHISKIQKQVSQKKQKCDLTIFFLQNTLPFLVIGTALRMKTSPQMKRPREFEENDGSPPAKRLKTKKIVFNLITSIKSFSSKEPPYSIQNRISQSKTMCFSPTKPKFHRIRKNKPIPEDLEGMNLELLEAAANGRATRAKCLIKNGANLDYILKVRYFSKKLVKPKFLRTFLNIFGGLIAQLAAGPGPEKFKKSRPKKNS